MATSYRLKRKMFMFGFNNFRKVGNFNARATAAGNMADKFQLQADKMKKSGNMTGYNDVLAKRNKWQNQQQNYQSQANKAMGKGVAGLAMGATALYAGKKIFDKMTGED